MRLHPFPDAKVYCADYPSKFMGYMAVVCDEWHVSGMNGVMNGLL
jgi:hypothetical protein